MLKVDGRGRGSRCVVVETDARLKQGSRVLKVAFSTLLFKLVDSSIIKAVLVEVLGESLKVGVRVKQRQNFGLKPKVELA